MSLSRSRIAITLTALLSLSAATSPVAAQPASPGPGGGALPPLSVRTPRYEIYASDSASLNAARANVEHAIARFQRYVGETPVPLAVVVLRGDGGIAGVDDRPFRARGFEVLPWLSATAIQGADRHGLLAHEACHVYLHAHVDRRRERAGLRAAGRMALGAYGHEDVPDWLDEAVASLCESDDDRLTRTEEMQERMAERIPLAELLSMQHPGARRTATIAASADVTTPPDTSAGIKPRIYRRDGRPITPEDEALIRRALAGEEGTGLSLRPTTDTAPAAGVVTHMRQLTPAEQAASGRILTFYAQSLSIARFVAARAGDAAIGRLVDAASEGRPVTDALTALPGLPGTLPAVEAAWLAWAQGEARQE